MDFMKKLINEHSIFTIAFGVLFFFSSLVTVNRSISHFYAPVPSRGMVAGAVTSTAIVPENPVNKGLAQIEKKEAELDQREKQLRNEQAQWQEQYNAQKRRLSYLFAVTGALLLLALINLYWDYKKNRTVLFRKPASMEE
jgi:hypothetical protein